MGRDDFKKQSHGNETESVNKNDTDIITDFSKFQINNWVSSSAKRNKTIQNINTKGGAVWMNPNGDLYFRRTYEEVPNKLPTEKAKTVLSNYLKKSVLIFKGVGTGENSTPPDIYPTDILMIEELFTPFASSEFYTHNNMWYRTSFNPSSYIKLKASHYKEPTTTLKLLNHLCGNNIDNLRWTINWLAGFFQTLKKSDVALVLRGVEGTGKGILMEQIIAPLFGEKFTITVDDDRLNSNFKDWIGEKLFFNLNEIAHDPKGRRAVINFIKVLITDRLIQMEAKNKDAKTTEVFGNILITSNEVAPLEISVTDRRFTVFQTGGNIRKLGWNTNETILAIKKELTDFAKMLKSYNVDWELYNTALDTPAKRSIVSNTNDRFSLFLTAIKDKDIDYFETLIDTGEEIYLDHVKKIFLSNEISIKQLTQLFNKTHNEDDEKEITTRIIMKRMRGLDSQMFETKGKKPIHGRRTNDDTFFTII